MSNTLKYLIQDYRHKLEKVEQLDEFHLLAWAFYNDSLLTYPVDIDWEPKANMYYNKVKAYPYPTDFLQWHEAFGNNLMLFRPAKLLTSKLIGNNLLEDYKLLTANGYLLIAEVLDSEMCYVYDLNQSPAVIKLVPNSAYYKLEELYTLYREEYQLKLYADTAIYLNPMDLDMALIFDEQEEYILNSPYIKSYLEKTLKEVPEVNNFLDFLKHLMLEAFRRFESLITHDPNYSKANPIWGLFHNKGCDYSSYKQFDLAIMEYNKSLAIEPTYESYHNIGFAYSGKGNQREALNYYHKSIAINPKYSLAHNNIAYSHYCLGEYEAALVAVNKAIATDKKSGLAYATKAEITFELNDMPAFYEALEQSIRLNFDPFRIDSKIHKALANEKQFKKLIKPFKK